MDALAVVFGTWEDTGGALRIEPDGYRFMRDDDDDGAPDAMLASTPPPWRVAPRGRVSIRLPNHVRTSDDSYIVAYIAFGDRPSATDRFYVVYEPATRSARLCPDFHVMAFPNIHRRL